MSKKVSKIQELVYELKVRDVMKDHVVTVEPETKMSELRTILKNHRISGAPVVDGDHLVGVVSVEDFIHWLTEGGNDATVNEQMSPTVRTLYADEPLVHAVSKLDYYGYGRFPVLNRDTKKLAGVITKGDIIAGLLHAIEVEYHAEEIHHYRASHFFEDILANRVSVLLEYRIEKKDIQHGGEVASALKKSFKRLGIHPDIVRRAAIATYEAEMNVLIYAGSGVVTVRVEPEQINIDIADQGPGIADIEQAMRPGYSTAPDWVRELGFGAGMGLNNIKNCAHEFEIDSAVDKGTRLQICIPLEKECA